jgi:hypothetical protein
MVLDLAVCTCTPTELVPSCARLWDSCTGAWPQTGASVNWALAGDWLDWLFWCTALAGSCGAQVGEGRKHRTLLVSARVEGGCLGIGSQTSLYSTCGIVHTWNARPTQDRTLTVVVQHSQQPNQVRGRGREGGCRSDQQWAYLNPTANGGLVLVARDVRSRCDLEPRWPEWFDRLVPAGAVFRLDETRITLGGSHWMTLMVVTIFQRLDGDLYANSRLAKGGRAPYHSRTRR